MLNISLTVITTALNEEQNVKNCLLQLHDFLKKNVREFAIVFVDDGSVDNSYNESLQLQHLKEIVFIKNSTNLGVGASIRKVLPEIKTEFFCWLPSDLEFLPNQLLEPLKLAHERDIVITYPENADVQRSFFRLLLSKIFVKIVNVSFSYQIKYYNGISIYRHSLVNHHNLFSDRFFCHVELLVKALTKTRNFVEVPVALSRRQWGKSNAIRLHVFFDVATCYLRLLKEQWAPK